MAQARTSADRLTLLKQKKQDNLETQPVPDQLQLNSEPATEID